tara:strand:+ start:227 stop:637 length:411 start_codon:yes stop_codon:yes gene_type:complete
MDSLSLEKQVNDLLTTKFEQPSFEQGLNLKGVFDKNMLIGSAGTALSVQIGNIVGRFLPIGQLPTGTSSILAGILMQKFGGNSSMLKSLSTGIIQGGIATAMTPFVSGLIPAQFSQEIKEVVQQEELNPLTKGVMW